MTMKKKNMNFRIWILLNQSVCSIMPSLTKGVFRSLATKLINMFSYFHFHIFFIPISVYYVKYYFLWNYPESGNKKIRLDTVNIEPRFEKEERSIMWAGRSENCLTRVLSWSKRVQKNLVFFMLRLWPDLINIESILDLLEKTSDCYS